MLCKRHSILKPKEDPFLASCMIFSNHFASPVEQAHMNTLTELFLLPSTGQTEHPEHGGQEWFREEQQRE